MCFVIAFKVKTSVNNNNTFEVRTFVHSEDMSGWHIQSEETANTFLIPLYYIGSVYTTATHKAENVLTMSK